MPPPKLRLSHLPTPIWRNAALDALIGAELWVKRDDMTAGAAAGNKIRKLEYLLADAQQRAADVVVTCGGFQSNHCRATAILARQLGMRAVLLLRTASADARPDTGNAFLSRLVGAELRLITPAQYARRTELLREAQRELERAGERAYVIPEGGSNGLGALGYCDAMGEVQAQLAADAALPRRFDAVVHACGSGGTAAGLSLGCARHGVADAVLSMAVCDDRRYFERVVAGIVEEGQALLRDGSGALEVAILDGYKGPGYAVASPEQLDFIGQVALRCGLILDPVYTGKALFGLSRLAHKPARALFIHTGGLPGLLAQAADFRPLHGDTCS